MKYAVESFTGIRPTGDLTIANYIGAVRPILDQEAAGKQTAIFLAELHATTTTAPADVLRYTHELSRTLLASGVSGEIYSQREMGNLVFEVQNCLSGLTTVARLLRLPTLKEKVVHSDNTENARVGLAMYPMLMAADIVLARPEEVPTGKDQRPHIELTNELIRAANNRDGTELPLPQAKDAEPVNVMSLDGTPRKMSKSYPNSAIFIDDDPAIAFRKVMKAKTDSKPGTDLNAAIDNMITIAEGLGDNNDDPRAKDIASLGESVKDGERRIKEFKELLGEHVVAFLVNMQERRSNTSDADVLARVNSGNDWFRPIGEETAAHIRDAYWRSA